MKKVWEIKTKQKHKAYEISSIGDKTYTDINCRLSNGKTIYESVESKRIEDYYSLWVRYFNENPNEYQNLLNKTLGYDLFTCSDAVDEFNPANGISWILNEYYGYNKTQVEDSSHKFFEW